MISRIKHYPWLSFWAFGAFIVLIGLCLWQIQRLEWKRALIHNLETSLAAPPTLIHNAKQLSDLPEFHRVEVEGTLLNSESLHLQARYYKSNLGFHLVTPLKLADGTIVFLNRGWIPQDYKTNPKVKVNEPEKVHVVGILRRDEHPRSFLPQNDPAKGLWLWQDSETWAKTLQTKMPRASVLPILIQQTHDAKKDDGFPIPQESHFELRNDHLQYAITWGCLSVILLIIYGIYTSPARKKL